jgi:hypothetical protein
MKHMPFPCEGCSVPTANPIAHLQLSHQHNSTDNTRGDTQSADGCQGGPLDSADIRACPSSLLCLHAVQDW